MCATPHAGADFRRGQETAIHAAQIRISFISPRQRQRDVDWRCTALQSKPTRAAYDAIFAHAHPATNLGSGEACRPIGGKFVVALFCPR
jgi:hypothetical protein